MRDDGGLSSDVALTDLTIQLVDDEPPQIRGTASNQTYTEEAGPVGILDSSVMIVDDDNCPDHQVVNRILVELLEPRNEDVLISENGEENFTIEYSCDQSGCYEDFLRGLQYDNANSEPDTRDRTIVIEVGK